MKDSLTCLTWTMPLRDSISCLAPTSGAPSDRRHGIEAGRDVTRGNVRPVCATLATESDE